MLTLYDYKDYIINYYVNEVDNSEDKINQRCFELLKKYNERYLQKIVDDTYDFISELPIYDILEQGYYKCDLDCNTISYISLNLDSGGFADTVYTTSDGKLISRYILRKTFGDNLRLSIKSEEIPFNNEEDYNDFLYIERFPKNINELQMKLHLK